MLYFDKQDIESLRKYRRIYQPAASAKRETTLQRAALV